MAVFIPEIHLNHFVIFDILWLMKITRRNLLKITGFSVLATAMLPRVAFCARNTLRSLRTGVQPGNKTRLVIETANRPSYNISYPTGQLVVDLSNTSANLGVSPSLAASGLVKMVISCKLLQRWNNLFPRFQNHRLWCWNQMAITTIVWF